MIFFIALGMNLLSAHDNDHSIYRDESWRQSITTNVIQQYQAPNDVLKILSDYNIIYNPEERSLMDLPQMYLKRDISRIVGHMRLRQLFQNEACTVFGVPEKYLVPLIDRKGILDIDQSYVISMIAAGDFVRYWDKNEVEKLVHFAHETGVVDFYYTNIKRDTNGKNWFIDTQLEKSNEDRRYRAAEQLLLNINWNVYNYHLEPKTVEYLKTVMKNNAY